MTCQIGIPEEAPAALATQAASADHVSEAPNKTLVIYLGRTESLVSTAIEEFNQAIGLEVYANYEVASILGNRVRDYSLTFYLIGGKALLHLMRSVVVGSPPTMGAVAVSTFQSPLSPTDVYPLATS